MIACCHDGWCGVHQSGTVLLVPFAIVALVSVKVCSGNRSVEFSSTSNLVHVFSFFLAGMSFFSFFLFSMFSIMNRFPWNFYTISVKSLHSKNVKPVDTCRVLS